MTMAIFKICALKVV